MRVFLLSVLSVIWFGSADGQANSIQSIPSASAQIKDNDTFTAKQICLSQLFRKTLDSNGLTTVSPYDIHIKKPRTILFYTFKFQEIRFSAIDNNRKTMSGLSYVVFDKIGGGMFCRYNKFSRAMTLTSLSDSSQLVLPAKN